MWLNIKNLNTARPSVKLDNRYISPFKVKRIFEKNPLIAELELPESIKIHLIFHVNLLSHIAIDPLSS